MTYKQFRLFIEHVSCNILNNIEMYSYLHLNEKNYKYVEKYVSIVTSILEFLHIIVKRQHMHIK